MKWPTPEFPCCQSGFLVFPDRQEAITAQQALMREAAKQRHGCEPPWLHHPTRLAAHLANKCFVSGSRAGQRKLFLQTALHPAKAAELNHHFAIHAKCLVRPMDHHARNCLAKKIRTDNDRSTRTCCLSIIFTSGIIHYADKPEIF